MSMQPPLLDVAPPLQCNRAFDWDDSGHALRYCGKTPTSHIFWNSELDNGIACDEHTEEIRQRWVFFAIHSYEMSCSAPGAVYVHDENRCVVPDEVFGEMAAVREEVPT